MGEGKNYLPESIKIHQTSKMHIKKLEQKKESYRKSTLSFQIFAHELGLLLRHFLGRKTSSILRFDVERH